MFLTDKQTKEFRDKGFVVLKGFFNRLSDDDMRTRYYKDKWKSYAPNESDDARSEESFRV